MYILKSWVILVFMLQKKSFPFLVTMRVKIFIAVIETCGDVKSELLEHFVKKESNL